MTGCKVNQYFRFNKSVPFANFVAVMKNLVIFASGSGTNAENLIKYFANSKDFNIAAVFCNRPDAFVLQRAARLDVPTEVFCKADLESGRVAGMLLKYDAWALILAGFLMMVPEEIVRTYSGRIINIHPALLPKYGGRGMHGMHVHEAVVAAGEQESGITIHLVDEQYDHGKTLFQAKCDVLPCDTAMDVAAKIHLLEQEHFPEVVDGYLSNLLKSQDMKHYVAGIGEALWDMLPSGKQLGGAPANFAYHACGDGLEGIAVSAIGKDALGEEIVASFKEHGLCYNLAEVDFPTGTVQVTLSGRGIPQYEIMEGVAWDNIPWTDELEAIAARCRAVCFGSLAQRSPVSRETIRRFLKTVPGECLKVFDINLRQHFYSEDIIRDSLHLCDILKINDEELVTVAGMLGYAGLEQGVVCGHLRKDFGLQMVILTCGINGSYIYYDGGMSFLNTPDSEVVDTVGAGDSFGGAFVRSILSGKSVPEAHRIAVDVSTWVCGCHGAMPPVKE